MTKMETDMSEMIPLKCRTFYVVGTIDGRYWTSGATWNPKFSANYYEIPLLMRFDEYDKAKRELLDVIDWKPELKGFLVIRRLEQYY